MEAIGIGAGLILLLILCASGSGSKSQPEYIIEETADNRIYEVKNRNGETVYIGFYQACEDWIRDHTTA